jgi:hypothetical protein
MFSSASRVLIRPGARTFPPRLCRDSTNAYLPRTSWPAAIGLKAYPGDLFVALRKHRRAREDARPLQRRMVTPRERLVQIEHLARMPYRCVI